MMLKEQMDVRYCLICGEKIKNRYLFFKDKKLCFKCQKEMRSNIKIITIDETKGLSFYKYDSFIKDLIFQYKGCSDFALKDVFLNRHRKLIKLIFHDYLIVPVPSFEESDIKRGFNHVEEIAKTIGLKIIKCLKKKNNIKQSSQVISNRKLIKDNIINDENISNIRRKNVLLIDDIITSGETIKACINVLKDKGAKRIFFIIIAQNENIMSNFDERIM